jgi:hypothetical protein
MVSLTESGDREAAARVAAADYVRWTAVAEQRQHVVNEVDNRRKQMGHR